MPLDRLPGILQAVLGVALEGAVVRPSFQRPSATLMTFARLDKGANSRLHEEHMSRDIDLAVARRLADDLRHQGQRRTWRKATTLLAMFGAAKLTPNVRTRISTALDEAGVGAEPPIELLDRSQTVRLTLADPPERPAATGGLDDPTARAIGIARVTEWRPGEFPREIRLADAAHCQGLLWVELDADIAQASTVIEELVPLSDQDLTVSLIDDLLQADPYPRMGRVDDDGTLRFVSAAMAGAEEDDDERAGAISGRLVFELVELLAGRRLLVSCWHKRKIYFGIELEAEDEEITREAVYGAVAAAWPDSKGSTVGDIGLLILHELAASYEQPARTLLAWLEQWELAFYKDHLTDLHALTELRGLVAEYRKRLSPLDVRREQALESWFADSTLENVATSTDRLIDEALGYSRSLNDELRRCFELVHGYQTTQHLKLAEEQTKNQEQLKTRLELIAAILLVPALVAGVYGANTRLPGGNSWVGFALMLALMAASAVLTLFLIRSRDRQQQRGGDSAVGINE